MALGTDCYSRSFGVMWVTRAKIRTMCLGREPTTVPLPEPFLLLKIRSIHGSMQQKLYGESSGTLRVMTGQPLIPGNRSCYVISLCKQFENENQALLYGSQL